MLRFRLATAVAGALVALAAVAVLALVGVFGGDGGSGRLPSVPPAFAQERGRINEIYDRARPSVVFIQARIERSQPTPFGPQQRQGVATGTGFVIDGKGSVVTNAHVVSEATDVKVRVDEDTLLDAEVVGADLATDLALLRIDPAKADVRPLPLGDSDAVDEYVRDGERSTVQVRL